MLKSIGNDFYKANDSREVVISSLSHFCLQRFKRSDTMSVYVGFEGYSTQSGFIHKELCIYYDTDRYDHYLFKKPEEKLSDADMVTVRWATCQLNHLEFEDGSVPYKEIGQILQKIEKYEIYTFSEVATNTLKRYIPNAPKIVNIQDFEFKMPQRLCYAYCFRPHTPRYCAKAKAKEVRKFVKLRR